MIILGYFIVTFVLLKQSPLPDCTGTSLHRSQAHVRLCGSENVAFIWWGGQHRAGLQYAMYGVQAGKERLAFRNALTSFVSRLN